MYDVTYSHLFIQLLKDSFSNSPQLLRILPCSGLIITANQRSMIGEKLIIIILFSPTSVMCFTSFLIGESKCTQWWDGRNLDSVDQLDRPEFIMIWQKQSLSIRLLIIIRPPPSSVVRFWIDRGDWPIRRS